MNTPAETADYVYNQYITQAIARYYEQQETEVLYALLQVLALRIADGACAPMPYLDVHHTLDRAMAAGTGAPGLQLVRQTLTDGSGDLWLPLYTDEDELDPGEQNPVLSDRILDILQAGLSDARVQGVIINPYGQPFAMKKALLQYFLESSGLLPQQENEAETAEIETYPEPGEVMTPQLERSMESFLKKYLVLMELLQTDRELSAWCEAYHEDQDGAGAQHQGLQKLICTRFPEEAYDLGLVIPEGAAICRRDGIDPSRAVRPDAVWASQFSREQLMALIACLISAEQWEKGAIAAAFGSGSLLVYANAFLAAADPLE